LIRIRILGSAAGGGLPQWNCSCPNCAAARTGKIPSQTQSSVAICGDAERWFLINASPDLAQQIESTPELQPTHDSPRNTPIAAVLLTNADLDHALGLLLLRQRDQPLVIYATEETHHALQWINPLLQRFCQVEWRVFGDSKLDCFKPSSLQTIRLRKSVALEFRNESSGGAVLIAPAVDQITDELHNALQRAEVIVFDGTFWSDDELRTFRPHAPRAREMNHLPISGGSFDLLRDAPARRKLYIHVNNTNPIWLPGSLEREQLERAGIGVGYDGLQLTV
jgi:pyrroloquinoline quinone biosynthesis protein B